MNILLDGLHLTSSHLRGIGHYTRAVCRAIDQFHVGHLMVLIATADHAHIEYLKRHLHGIEYKLIRVPLPGRLFYALIRYFDFFRFLRFFIPFDILHIPYECFYKTHVKNTMTIHGMSPFIYPRSSSFEIRFRHNVILSKDVVTKYLAVSQGTKNDILQYLPLKDTDIFSVPISIDDYFFTKEKKNTDRSDHLDLFYFGAFERNKNHQNLMKALDHIYKNHLLQFTLTVIGHERWSLDDTKYYFNKPYIRQIGYLEHQELIERLCSASCVIIPSIYEGYGLPIIESLAMGIPVLASKTIYALDYVGKGYITFDPFSSDDIIRALLQFKTLRTQIESEAKLEREQIRRNLSIDKMAGLLKNAYQQILG